MASGGFWWLLMASDGFRWLLMASNGFWWLLTTRVRRTQDDVEIVDTEEQSTGDSYASYLAEGHTRRENRKIILSPELGLAMEELPEGYTVQSLWQVV